MNLINNYSLILARRLLIEGAKVKAIIDESIRTDVDSNLLEIVSYMGVDIIENSKVVDLYGNERIESIDVEYKEDKSIKNIQCDSLILTVGYFPEIAFIRKHNIGIDEKKNIIINNYETTTTGIFACGTVLTKEKEIFKSGEDGYKAGVVVSNYLKLYDYK